MSAKDKVLMRLREGLKGIQTSYWWEFFFTMEKKKVSHKQEKPEGTVSSLVGFGVWCSWNLQWVYRDSAGRGSHQSLCHLKVGWGCRARGWIRLSRDIWRRAIPMTL